MCHRSVTTDAATVELSVPNATELEQSLLLAMTSVLQPDHRYSGVSRTSFVEQLEHGALAEKGVWHQGHEGQDQLQIRHGGRAGDHRGRRAGQSGVTRHRRACPTTHAQRNSVQSTVRRSISFSW